MSWPPSFAATTKDWLQAGAWIAAAIVAILTVIKFWSEFTQAREQRDRELRWRQAAAGKDLNDEMQDDALAWPALQMLDFSGREFELPSKNRIAITHQDVRDSLNPRTPVVDEKNIYIRDCFDSLFYYLAMFHHYINSGLIRRDDVAFP